MDPAVASKVEDFFARYPKRDYAKGEILIRSHEDPAHIFQLLDGRVKQYDISWRGDEIILNVFKSLAFFPMSYAINRMPNVYFYEAQTAVSVRLAPVDDALRFVQDNPDVAFDLLSRVYRGADGLLGRLAHLMAGSARSRVLYELLIESRRFGQPSGRGIAIAVSESDIGANAGLARETVSREIRKLKAEGIIEVVKNDIIIAAPDRLQGLVGHEL